MESTIPKETPSNAAATAEPTVNVDSSVASNDKDVPATAEHVGGSAPAETTTTTTQVMDVPFRQPLFSLMIKYPFPFLVTIPILFALLAGLGWTIPKDIVEDEVNLLWVARDGSYARDQRYADSLGKSDLGATSFAALAIARDGGNILTSERLEEIRRRMEETESIKVEYKGNTYTWEDICYLNSFPYRFPCLRLSPMDLFQEARWYFTDDARAVWYTSGIQDTLIAPRIPRFGILTQMCQVECGSLLLQRGLVEKNPLMLFADLGNLEYSNPCRKCVEAKYTTRIQELYASIPPTFSLLRDQVRLYITNLKNNGSAANDAQITTAQDIADKLDTLVSSITTDDVVDFYSYYTLRSIYAQVGSVLFQSQYQQYQDLIQACLDAQSDGVAVTCPKLPADMTDAEAQKHLAAQADGPYSSVTTAGSPFPFWSDPSKGDGGTMFGTNAENQLYSVSGSGVRMSAEITSLAVDYLDAETLATDPDGWKPAFKDVGYADPTSEKWQTLVETNPLYAWFMAGVTPADAGAVCGNGNLASPATGNEALDTAAAKALANLTETWCTSYNIPNPDNAGTGSYTKQHFARMWYDLLLTSPTFLNVVQGKDDPYTWTTGAGCGYKLGGERFAYTNASVEDILGNASRDVYNIDEGTLIGAVDRTIMIGGATPDVGYYNMTNPLKIVKLLQSLYAALRAQDIPDRVKHCDRPGGPIDLSLDDAKELLFKWKEAMESAWTRGWNDPNAGEVQFVSFFDDAGGPVGSTGRMLKEITLDNTRLTIIAIFLIAGFSVAFLLSFDPIESRVLVTLVGVALVVLSYYSAIGFSLLLGIKINVSISWTLPFVILGLGVDDVYIMLLALKKQRGYSEWHWRHAMKEVVVPVTMTSVINACMFAILNVSDIPAVYLTSRVACYCTIFLYISVMFCFPAYCYLDLKRQQAGRVDVALCLKNSEPSQVHIDRPDIREVWLYDYYFKPLVLNSHKGIRYVSHLIIVALSIGLLVVGGLGIKERRIGLGLEDFFPKTNPAGRWAELRTQELASWNVGLKWGALNYTDPYVQMKMIKQFESVIMTPNIAEMDTSQLWMADLQVWTTRHCNDNFAREHFDELKCGRDQVFTDGSMCAGVWFPNDFGLRLKDTFDPKDKTCRPDKGGICLAREDMHPDDLAELAERGFNESSAESFCPVIADWSDEKWQFCMLQWGNLTGSSASFVLDNATRTPTECSGVYYNDAKIRWPIPVSASPMLWSYDLFSHEETLVMMEQTRAFCDDDPELHCWMVGIPFDYWTQYEGIFGVLVELSTLATCSGFVISFLFLLGIFTHDGLHSTGRIIGGSLVGALLIGFTIVLVLIPVIGLSMFAGVNLTGFSNMSFVLSVGFAVEYSVHIVARWMRADMSHATSHDRVEYSMSFLMLPTFMSFVSSTIGVACLAFTQFEFNLKYFFRPLLIVMFVSYWFGCWFLPVLLSYLDFDMAKMGEPVISKKVVNEDDGSAEGIAKERLEL